MIGEIRQNFTEASASVGLILATALQVKRQDRSWPGLKSARYISKVQKYSYKKCFNKEASSKANNAILLKKGNQNLATTVTIVHFEHY